MKDVRDLLNKRLQRLEAPFSREWLTDFSSLMGFIQTNSFTRQILNEIKTEKTLAHKSLISHPKALSADGNKCLKETDRVILILNEVEDPRKPSCNFHHSLTTIIFISLMGVLCGAKDCEEIVQAAHGMAGWIGKEEKHIHLQPLQYLELQQKPTQQFA